MPFHSIQYSVALWYFGVYAQDSVQVRSPSTPSCLCWSAVAKDSVAEHAHAVSHKLWFYSPPCYCSVEVNSAVREQVRSYQKFLTHLPTAMFHGSASFWFRLCLFRSRDVFCRLGVKDRFTSPAAPVPPCDELALLRPVPSHSIGRSWSWSDLAVGL